MHEAGHAVVALAMGFPSVACELVATRGQATPGGLPPPADTAPPPSREVEQAAALCHAAICYAGVQAELLALGIRPPVPIRRGDDDHALARKHLHEAFGCDTPAGYCQALARSILSQRWAAVEDIAASLLEHGAINLTAEP